MKGLGGDKGNPDERRRFCGRFTYNFLELEKDCFKRGSHLGKKKVLALSFGFDSQNDLVLSGKCQNYLSWTANIFFDYPFSFGSITFESSYIEVHNAPLSKNRSRIFLQEMMLVLLIFKQVIFSLKK